MNLLQRRREMMREKPWIEMQFNKTAFNKNTSSEIVSYNSETDTISVKQKTAGTYKSGDAPFTTESGYEYKIICKYNAISGTARIGTRNNNYNFISRTELINAPANGEFSLVFSHDSDISMITLMSSWSNSVKGDVDYIGLTIYRRKL